MPAIEGDLMGVKLVTVYERNVNLPTHQAVIQLLSAKTGEPLIAMDGRLITEMRTAAVSAIATRLFAPQQCSNPGHPRQRRPGPLAFARAAAGARLFRCARLEPHPGSRPSLCR